MSDRVVGGALAFISDSDHTAAGSVKLGILATILARKLIVFSPSAHGIPGLKLRTLESYVERLAAIEADATSDEMPTLAYLVSIAKLEAEAQVKRARAAEEERKAGPDDLWRPA